MYTLPLVQNLWSVAQYGIDKVRAFLHCPAYGKCRKANKRERKENVPEVCIRLHSSLRNAAVILQSEREVMRSLKAIMIIVH
jgi:hypothetical protein